MWQRTNFIITSIFFLILFSFITIASSDYPALVFSEGVNKTMVLDAINTINSTYFKGINRIQFINHSKYNEKNDVVSGEYITYISTKSSKLRVWSPKIIIYVSPLHDYYDILWILTHELGHHDCFTRANITTLSSCYGQEAEQKADDYWKYMELN